MSITINPGSGPVEGATLEQAKANMDAFCADLKKAGLHPTGLTRNEAADGQGRYGYVVAMGDARKVEVEMPGTPLDQVRYVDAPGQDIWDFPRLYIDGGSWIWMFAVHACRPPEGYVAPDRSGPTPYEQAAEDQANDSAPERCGDPDCDC